MSRNSKLLGKTLLIVIIIFIIGGFYLEYIVKKHDLRPLVKYSDVKIPESLNCTSVHNGNFETDDFIIIRHNNKQTHTNKESGESQEYFVNWKSDCEYILTSVLDKTQIYRVKITEVNIDNYGCHIVKDKQILDYSGYMVIERSK